MQKKVNPKKSSTFRLSENTINMLLEKSDENTSQADIIENALQEKFFRPSIKDIETNMLGLKNIIKKQESELKHYEEKYNVKTPKTKRIVIGVTIQQQQGLITQAHAENLDYKEFIHKQIFHNVPQLKQNIPALN